MARPQYVSTPSECVDALIERVGPHITIGLALGIGKPVRFINALYERARQDATIHLHIVTGLSLLAPGGSSSLERRFMGPFVERLYGDIPEPAYARDADDQCLPDNVRVTEFFFQAGRLLANEDQQRNFICTNYTHVVRDLLDMGINVIGQLVSPARSRDGGNCVSLSCNPDLTLDLLPLMRERQTHANPVAVVGECNRHLPFLGHHAAVPVEALDLLLDVPDGEYPLFSLPQTPVSPQDHMIGFHASTLLKDGGTLQVGIGSLGSALVNSVILRHRHNGDWKRLFEHLDIGGRFPVASRCGGTEPFPEGLYGCSEMLVDGFLYLMEAGILTRSVRDRNGSDVVVHAGFFAGPETFYEKLRDLTDEQRDSICMTSVQFVNNLYDHAFGDQRTKVGHRAHARFFNTAMMHTLNGSAISDGLEDGRVVSGVGGQFDFVAMAHELPDARSIIALRSTRESKGDTVSNIVFRYGHCTIPRHLKDIVVTEYGIADLRGQSDEQVCLDLIRIADSRFQPELLHQAREAGKVHPDFELPEAWRGNIPEAIERAFRETGTGERFEPFPFGCDFTEDELIIVRVLKHLEARTATAPGRLATLLRALVVRPRSGDNARLLARMGLDAPRSWRDRLDRRLFLYGVGESE
jgi:acyl-CoA hydrolase